MRRAAERSGRPFVAVRFGNVLGSRGSVVPLFRQQIAAGGPITITDPEMTRYFMTIPEAAQLVMQAAALGQRGDVFVLDMGEPVKIVDLARDLVHLSGYQVGRDIQLEFTGLRPGEKLVEELFNPEEQYSRTLHERIFRARNGNAAHPVLPDKGISDLIALAKAGETEAARDLLYRLGQVESPCADSPLPG